MIFLISFRKNFWGDFVYLRSLVLALIIGAMLLYGCSNDSDHEEENDVVADADDIENETIDEEETDDYGDTEIVQSISPELREFLEELPSPPQNVAEIVNQMAGPFAMPGTDWNDELYDELYKEFEKIEPLREDATEEEMDLYFKFFYSLIAYDFADPQDTIKKWEFSSFGDPDLPDSRFHFKENFNIEILLDASGSMGNYIDDKMMMDIAKESIHNFLKNVPEDANISFRVYGHKGTSSRSDQEMSCEAIEQVFGYAPYDEELFQKELDQIQPAGWTPLAEALKQAEEALKEFDTEHHTNLIYVVSDGVETCGGAPVTVAKSLADSDAKPIINIIGFNVDSDAQRQLREMAEVSGGIFAVANDQSELEDEFKRAEEVLKAWDDWKKDALKDVERLRVRSSFDIIEFTNDWWPKVLRQSNNLNRVLREAYNEELITMQQRDYLQRKNNEVQDFIDNVQDELEEQLKEISTETIESMKEMIEDRYDANIGE